MKAMKTAFHWQWLLRCSATVYGAVVYFKKKNNNIELDAHYREREINK